MREFFSSRGSFIITQKENKGEYNSGWEWSENDIYAHVMDQNGKQGTTDGIPIRYASNTTNYSSTNNIPQCSNDYSVTHGNTIYSDISEQVSCNPNTLNAGNYYNFPAATAGSDTHLATNNNSINTLNSICPKGWQLPPNAGNKSYNTLIRTAYDISDTTSDTNLLNNSAMSFTRFGNYVSTSGLLDRRGTLGIYRSSNAYNSTSTNGPSFSNGRLNPQNGNSKAGGGSVRCVSR